MCNGLKTTPAIPNKSPLWNKPPLFRTFFEFQWITVVCYTCGSDDTWDDRVLQEIMQLQPLRKTQNNFQYFWPSLLGTDILMVKLQTETPTVSALREKDWIILEEFHDAGKRKWQQESIRQRVQKQDAFSSQEGVAASLQTQLAGVHLLFKASTALVLWCHHRNSKV